MTTWSFCRLMLGIAWSGWAAHALVAAGGFLWPPLESAEAGRAHGAIAVVGTLAIVLAQLWIALFAALEARHRPGHLAATAALALGVVTAVVVHVILIARGVIATDLAIHIWISLGLLLALAGALVGERRWLAGAVR